MITRKFSEAADNNRSLFLQAFFKKASGNFSDKMMHAYVTGNTLEFKKYWDELTRHMLDNIKK